jgi:hypothetical protein
MLFLLSCSRQANDDCSKHIKDRIPLGSTAQFAESELKKCGFTVTPHPDEKSIYADKMLAGQPVSERTQVSISFDSDNKITNIQITNSLTGP